MDPREWFNLPHLYRTRFSPTSRMDSKLSLARCNKGVRMCCGRVGGVVVVVGAALVVLGLTQLLAGTYFMLALPIFQLGSNIWTGSWSGLCGMVVASIGWKKQTMRRGQVVLVATLSVLVADVANLVILQVGENGVFFTLEDSRTIVENNQEISLNIAIWMTTILAALGIVVSFFGAQYLFCVVVRGPRVKGRMPITRSLSEEDLQHRQVQTTKFQSPSLTTVRAPSEDQAVDTTGGTGDGGGGDGGAVHGFPGDGDAAAGCGNGRDSGSSGGGNDGSNKEPPNKRRGGRKEGGKARSGEGNVPYFLRNHQSAWRYILPEIVQEITINRLSTEEPCEPFSRTSTLSRHSKSSFQPHRPVYTESEDGRLGSLTPDPQQLRASRPSSSCNTSLYSVPESGSEVGLPRHLGRVVRPSVPPPPPPAFSSSNLKSVSAGGWDPCPVMQYPGQAGCGFVVDLD